MDQLVLARKVVQETVRITLMVRMPRLEAAFRFGPRSSRKMASEGCRLSRCRQSWYIRGSGLQMPSRQDSTTWGERVALKVPRALEGAISCNSKPCVKWWCLLKKRDGKIPGYNLRAHSVSTPRKEAGLLTDSHHAVGLVGRT